MNTTDILSARGTTAVAPVLVPKALRLRTWARFFYLAALALGLLALMPAALIPAPFLKLALCATALALAALCFLFSGGSRELPGAFTLSIGAVFLLPLAYALSWWFSIDRAVSFMGIGNEVDTFVFIVLGFIAFFMAALLFRRPAETRLLLGTIAALLFIAILFQFFVIFFGALSFPSLLPDKTANLIGKWNDLSLLAALFAVMVVGGVQWWNLSLRNKVIAGILLAITALLLFVVNFALAWWFVLAGVALIAGSTYLAARRAERSASMSSSSGTYWFAGTMAVVALVGGFWGGAFNAHIPSIFSVPSLEVRPAYSSTYQIGQVAHTSAARTLIGTGPNTFGEEWLLHKPASVNQTQFWSVDFITGFSVVSTVFVSLGLLGVIVWILPFLLIVWCAWKLLISPQEHADRTMGILSIVALLLWISLFFYAPSQDVVLLAFATAGALFGGMFLGAPTGASSRLAKALGALCALILIVAVLGTTFLIARRALSMSYEGRAAAALSQNSIDIAAGYNARSEQFERTGVNLRLGVSIDLAKLQQIITSTSTDPNTQRAAFQAALADAVNNQGQGALSVDPKNYQSYLGLAGVYEALVPLNIQGAYEQSKQSYEQAMALDPTNPAIPLLLARLEANTNLTTNLSDVGNLLTESLKLKNNYTDALLFSEQLAVSQNDLQTATAAAAAAVQSAPDQAPLWFQLGLFYYVGGDMTNAASALEHAVELVPDYANAKYFLGLAYNKQGRTDDALAQFADIARTNPNNTELPLIIANIKAGKDPFAGEVPPPPPPAARATAPVQE